MLTIDAMVVLFLLKKQIQYKYEQETEPEQFEVSLTWCCSVFYYLNEFTLSGVIQLRTICKPEERVRDLKQWVQIPDY